MQFEGKGNVTVRISMYHTTLLLAAAAAAIAIAGAPSASAAPSEQSCSDAGGSTNCQRPGNVQVHTSPRALAAVFPPSINPRWRDLAQRAVPGLRV
jgi:microcystin-dependent protein